MLYRYYLENNFIKFYSAFISLNFYDPKGNPLKKRKIFNFINIKNLIKLILYLIKKFSILKYFINYNFFKRYIKKKVIIKKSKLFLIYDNFFIIKNKIFIYISKIKNILLNRILKKYKLYSYR
jgi:hypothetical protein